MRVPAAIKTNAVTINRPGIEIHAGVVPSTSDRAAAINDFGAASTTSDVPTRARALRRVSENSTLQQQEFNRAFVLMQYFGYLRRNPNDPPEGTLDFQG